MSTVASFALRRVLTILDAVVMETGLIEIIRGVSSSSKTLRPTTAAKAAVYLNTISYTSV